MPKDGFILPVTYLRHAVEQLREMRADTERWLESSRLTEAELSSSAIEFDSQRLVALSVSAVELSREPAFWLLVGKRMTVTSHGLLGFAVMSCRTVREAAEILARYLRVRMPLVATSIESAKAEVRVRFDETRPFGDARRPVLEGLVMSSTNMARAISVEPCAVGRVAFSFPEPEYGARARELFGCEVEYGAGWTGFSFPSEALDLALKTPEPEALETTARLCQRELEVIAARESVTAQVRRAVLLERDRVASLRAIARALHVAPRTLHRRLGEEGTSYREIVEDVRHSLAVEHLKGGRTSIQELTSMLGYSDVASFRRAFKRWELVPPSSFKSTQTRTE